MPISSIVVELEFTRAEQAEDPYAFRFAAQDYLQRTSGGGFERSHLMWDAALLADLAALRQRKPSPVLLQRIGEALRRFLMPLGWGELAAQIAEAVRQGRRVLLTIRSAAAELYALPWELVTLKQSGQHLGELPGVLLRYEWPETVTTAEQPVPRSGSGRILLAWSAAGGAVPAAEHASSIAAACQAGFMPFSHESDILPNASLEGLSAALCSAKQENRPISVLHLLAHGSLVDDTFGLMMDAEPAGGGPAVVDAGRLRQLLAPYAGMVRLVVLMACDSGNTGTLGNQLGSVTQTLHRAGIAAVIGSRYPLSLAGSTRFTRALYSELLVGPDSLESAVLAARESLAKDTSYLDWAGVQLYARCADGDDTRPLVFRPYQGLACFSIENSRFYFGRAALTERIWQRCNEIFSRPHQTRLLAVLGPSGSGKSSVARAGLLAELSRRALPAMPALRVATLKPGDQPLRALERALAALSPASAQSPVLVFVDQFEEVYTLCSDPQQRDEFVGRLMRMARDPDRHNAVVLTLRSDFFGETQAHHRELNQLIASQHELVPALTDDQLRQAVAEPARKVGRPLDAATVELLLKEAGGSEGALPLLQFALARIWEGVLAGKRASATLRKIGGVGGALASNAKEIYGSLTELEQQIARRALVRLVKLGEGTRDTRRRVAMDELCGRGHTAPDVLAVLRRFSAENARLVTLSSSGAETLAEVTHEALFEHWLDLRRWINEGRADRRFHDRLSEAARLWNEDRARSGRLWRPPDLDMLRAYAARKPEDLSKLDEEFLTASEEAQQAELAEKRVAEQRLSEAHDRLPQQLLSTFVEQGRRLLVEGMDPSAALLWLHRAQSRGSRDPILLVLLRDAMRHVDATLLVLVGHRDHVLNAQYDSTGRRIVTASDERTARILDAESGRLIAELHGHRARVRSAVFSPDDRFILTASEDSTARIWDAATGQLLADLQGHKGKVKNARFSPNGRCILTASDDQTVRVWDAYTGRLLHELNAHGGSIRRARFSHDGRHIVAAGGASARVWDASGGRLNRELGEHLARVRSATYSPDGRRIITASADQTIRVWDAETGCLLTALKGHGSSVHSATYSPDNQRILSASGNLAAVWDAETGRRLIELTGHKAGVNSANYSPDGRRIVTSSADKTARLWDAETGRLLAVLRGHGASVWSAMFSPDSRFIVTASVDKTARVWDVSPETRTAEQVAQQIRRRLLVRFESEGSSVIVPAVPELADG